MLKNYRYTLVFLAWITFVTYASLSSFDQDNAPTFNLPQLDKAVHFTFYFVAAFLAAFLLRERTLGKVGLRKALVFSVVFSVGFGIIIEVLQYTLTVDRQGDVLDAMANTIGALLGAFAIKLLFSGRTRLKWEI